MSTVEHALHGNEQEDHSHAHPSESIYIRIALILVAITTVEVAIYYIQWFHDSGTLVPALAFLSFVKFVTVVGFYMHLKFDDARFRYIFMCGLVLAVSIVAALVVLLRTHKIEYGLRLISGA
jgi:cytochrome c oxidase subunit 4